MVPTTMAITTSGPPAGGRSLFLLSSSTERGGAGNRHSGSLARGPRGGSACHGVSASDDLAGVAGVDHDREPGLRPGLHPAAEVHGVEPPLGEDARGSLGPSADPAHGDNGHGLIQGADVGGERGEGDVHGLRCVAGLPLVGLSHVEEDGALFDATDGFFGADGGDGGLALHTPMLGAGAPGCKSTAAGLGSIAGAAL